MFSSKYGKCQSGSISATPSAEMNSVEMTFAIAVIPSSRVVSVGSMVVGGRNGADFQSSVAIVLPVADGWVSVGFAPGFVDRRRECTVLDELVDAVRG